MDCTVEPITLLATMLTDRPVAFVYNRYEEMQISSAARGRAHLYFFKDGSDERRARIVAVRSAAISIPAPIRGIRPTAHRRRLRISPAPIRSPNGGETVPRARDCVYTNRTPSSAMRGFWRHHRGLRPQSADGQARAHASCMDPLEFRFINAYRDDDMKARIAPVYEPALIECMQEASIWPDRPVGARFGKRRRARRVSSPSRYRLWPSNADAVSTGCHYLNLRDSPRGEIDARTNRPFMLDREIHRIAFERGSRAGIEVKITAQICAEMLGAPKRSGYDRRYCDLEYGRPAENIFRASVVYDVIIAKKIILNQAIAFCHSVISLRIACRGPISSAPCTPFAATVSAAENCHCGKID